MDTRFNTALANAWDLLLQEDREMRAVLAISGGADSLALMHWCAHTPLIPNQQLHIVHIDHQLRAESEQEGEQIADWARAWGLPLTLKRVDVAKLARSNSLSIEDAGRKARYRMLADCAVAQGAKIIVTGHHADDQAETILLHLLRGTGPRGLQGMLHIGPVPGATGADLTLFRPLLSLTRSDINAYIAAHGLVPLVDQSNLDQTFLRNRIRHELMPLLETYNPKIQSGLNQLALLMQGEHEVLESVYDDAWGRCVIEATPEKGIIRLDFDKWQGSLVGVQRSLLRRGVALLCGDLSDIVFEVIDGARQILLKSETGTQADLGRGIQARRAYGELILQDRRRADHNDPIDNRWPQLPVDTHGNAQTIEILPVQGTKQITLPSGWVASIYQLSALDEIRYDDSEWVAHIALPREAVFYFRGRIEGERFLPFRFDGRIKLKKLLIDRKVPVAVRGRLPILADDKGILWVPGIRLADRAAVKENQANLIVYRIELKQA